MKTKINIGDNSGLTQTVNIETFKGGKQIVSIGSLSMVNRIDGKSPIKTETIEVTESDAKRLSENPDQFEIKKGKVEKVSKKRVG